MLAYKGMGVFPAWDADLPTQLWIAARYLQGLSFLLAPFFLGRKLSVHLVLAGYALVTSLLLGLIFYWRLFPTCLVEGTGLTPFKKISEYVISLVLLASIGVFSRKRREFDEGVFRFLVASIILTIASELSFTFYVHVYGLSNLTGHYLKIIASYLVYKAIVETGLAKPFALVFRDLKQSEDALRRERDFTSAVLSTEGALVVVLDREGRIIRFNSACEELTGYAFEELRGKVFWDQLLIPEEVDAVKAVFTQLRSGDFPNENENHWATKEDGQRLIMWSNTALLDDEGSVEYVIATGIDITDRKKLEVQLSRAKDEWERTFDAVPDLIMIIDNEQRIVRVNEAMAKKLGVAPYELAGLPCYKAVHHTTEPPAACPHTRMVADGLEHTTELADGFLGGHYLVSVSPLIDENGTLLGCVHVARDITERKRAEDALKRAHDELEQRVHERTEELLKANVRLRREIDERRRMEESLKGSEAELRRLSSELLKAHEEESKRIGQELHDGLAQTLSAVKMRIESALVHMDREHYDEVLRSLQSIVPTAQGAVEEVRRISRHLWPHILDDLGIMAALSWLCNEFKTVCSRIDIERQIHIQEEDLPESLKIVVFRVAQEALNNVAKHSQADLVRFSLSAVDGEIQLFIQDDGQGFDVGKVLSGDPSQIGLGLASMRERTELSGGSLVIESQRGSGTCIRAFWR
jgi:PAS domain S-box-containing protein